MPEELDHAYCHPILGAIEFSNVLDKLLLKTAFV